MSFAPGDVVVHYKSSAPYAILHEATFVEAGSPTGVRCFVYRNLATGETFAREISEFYDEVPANPDDKSDPARAQRFSLAKICQHRKGDEKCQS